MQKSKSLTFPNARKSSTSHPSVILKEGWVMVSTERKTKILHRCAVSVNCTRSIDSRACVGRY